MTASGYLDGSAPPFIILALAFTIGNIVPPLLTWYKERSRGSRLYNFIGVMVYVMLFFSLSLGLITILRIYLKGQNVILGNAIHNILMLDMVIIFNVSISLSALFISVLLLIATTRSYNKLGKAHIIKKDN